MKKILGLLLGLTLLTGCAESLALLGPTSTAATGGNIAQTAFSSAVNYGVKNKLGKAQWNMQLHMLRKWSAEKKSLAYHLLIKLIQQFALL